MRAAISIALALFVQTVYSADCRKTGTVCIDSTPCKSISGVNVCLTEIGQTCWEEEDTYSCLKPNAVDYCQPLVNLGCWQTNSQCTQTDNYFNSGCMRYTQTYRCSDPNQTAPANTTVLADSYTLVSSSYQNSCTAPGPNCAVAENRCIQTTPSTPLPAGITNAQAAPDGCFQRQITYACTTVPSAQVSTCTASSSTCIDTTPSKVVNGVTVTLAQAGGCWRYRDDCVSPLSIDYCAPLASNAQCSETTSICAQTDATFNTGCMRYRKTYRCGDSSMTTPANTIELADSYTLVSSSYQNSCTAPGPNCAVAENRCIQTTPSTPLPAGITNAQAAPDGCFQRQTTYACTTVPSAQVSTCTASSSTCIDTTPSKVVNGVTVTLAQAGGCWRYRDDCVSPLSIDYCAPLASSAQCRETTSSCTQSDTTLNTGCMRYRKTYRCDNPDHPAPANTITLDDSYTLLSTGYNASACASLEDNLNCVLAEAECTSRATPALPPGITPEQAAPDGCQQITRTYACLTGPVQSDCEQYQSNANCVRQSTDCDQEDRINGQCTIQRNTYRCQTAPTSTSTVVDCSGQQFCQNGNCFDTGYQSDPDFGRAMVMMEAAREAGVYGEPQSIFNGMDSRCTINQLGLANCCKKSGGGGGMSNSAVMGVAMQAGRQTLQYGSAYAYDALFSTSAPNWVVDGLGAMAGASASYGPGMAANMFSPTFSLYGLTATTGTLATGVTSLGSVGGVQFGFNPYALGLQLAVMVLQELLSCEQSEQILAMKLGQDLCHEVGSYCSKRFLGKCITKTVSHCCYNSRLARLINEQGRSQIGKPWGNPSSPDCSGFTMAEMEALDFSQMDLSEFVAEVMGQVNLPNRDGLSSATLDSVTNRARNYYERGSQ